MWCPSEYGVDRRAPHEDATLELAITALTKLSVMSPMSPMRWDSRNLRRVNLLSPISQEDFMIDTMRFQEFVTLNFRPR